MLPGKTNEVAAAFYLITEDESYIIVVNFCVHEEGSFEIYPAKSVEADSQSRVTEHRITA
jgi:hypothetical protein